MATIEDQRREFLSGNFLTSANGGKRAVAGVRWDLIPFEALEEVAKVLNYGANKYEEENWKNIDFEHSEQSPINHGIRHFSKATTYSPGSDERIWQLAKAATNALFQLWREVKLREKNKADEAPF